jgi:hypothetical protein
MFNGTVIFASRIVMDRVHVEGFENSGIYFMTPRRNAVRNIYGGLEKIVWHNCRT